MKGLKKWFTRLKGLFSSPKEERKPISFSREEAPQAYKREFSTVSERKRGKQRFSEIKEKAGKPKEFSAVLQQEQRNRGFSPVPVQKREQRAFSAPPALQGKRTEFSTNTQRLAENFKGFSEVSFEENTMAEEQREQLFPRWERADSEELSRRIEMESRRCCPNLEEDDW